MTHGTTVVRSFALALLVAICPLRTPAQSPTLPEATDNEQFVAYWTTETGWHSELQLRNNRTDGDLVVTPTLRLADGAETALAPVTIKPQEVQSLDLEAAVTSAAPQLIGTYGSVVLRYHSIGDLNLYAAMMIHNIGHPIAFHIDAMGESQDMQAGSREGVWWLPKDTTSDYLILTNQGGDTIPLDLSLYDASGQKATQKLLLGPRETNRYSLRKVILAAGLTGSYGGIKVAASTHAGALDSQHFLFDETAGFSAVLKMFDHDANAKLEERDFAKTAVWTTRAPMLALSNPDPALAFPTGTTLRPQLFVRNTDGKPADAALRFNWRGSGVTGKGPQITLHLNPFETRRVDVAALTFPPQANWTSVTLTTNGKPDEVMAVAASYDDTLRYGAQTPFSDQLNFAWQGGRWEFDPQHNSIITAGNGGTKPTLAAFTIFYNQGTQRYDLEQALQPDEQMWMDVGKLIREHVQDKNGKTLPDTLTSGSYEFRDLTDIGVGSLFEGKVIYDKTYGHVTYGCGKCCAYSGPYFLFNPLGIPFLDGSQQFVNATSNCGGAGVDVTSAYGTWSTANPAIAKVVGAGYHEGMAMGSTTTTASGWLVYSANRFCPQNLFTNTGGDKVAPKVTFSNTPLAPLGKPVTITATVYPSTNTTPITLTISTTSGTGSATFETGSTTKTITTTTVLTIVGMVASSTANNMKLAATVSSAEVAYTTFTVTAPITGAIPVEFRQTVAFVSGVTPHFEYKWGSSSGNLADLSACKVQETITFVGPNPYPWASPPYLPNQLVVWPDHGLTPISGTLGGLQDDHGHADGWLKPYVHNLSTSNQVYEFQCLYYQNNTWTRLMPLNGTIPITREIKQNSTTWSYTISKSGLVAIGNLP
jgi:hypothetical protein